MTAKHCQGPARCSQGRARSALLGCHSSYVSQPAGCAHTGASTASLPAPHLSSSIPTTAASDAPHCSEGRGVMDESIYNRIHLQSLWNSNTDRNYSNFNGVEQKWPQFHGQREAFPLPVPTSPDLNSHTTESRTMAYFPPPLKPLYLKSFSNCFPPSLDLFAALIYSSQWEQGR